MFILSVFTCAYAQGSVRRACHTGHQIWCGEGWVGREEGLLGAMDKACWELYITVTDTKVLATGHENVCRIRERVARRGWRGDTCPRRGVFGGCSLA